MLCSSFQKGICRGAKMTLACNSFKKYVFFQDSQQLQEDLWENMHLFERIAGKCYVHVSVCSGAHFRIELEVLHIANKYVTVKLTGKKKKLQGIILPLPLKANWGFFFALFQLKKNQPNISSKQLTKCVSSIPELFLLLCFYL